MFNPKVIFMGLCVFYPLSLLGAEDKPPVYPDPAVPHYQKAQAALKTLKKSCADCGTICFTCSLFCGTCCCCCVPFLQCCNEWVTEKGKQEHKD